MRAFPCQHAVSRSITRMSKYHTRKEKKRLVLKGDSLYCGKCGEHASYCERHDAHYCETCDWWLETACLPECDGYKYFGGRPARPSEVKKNV